MHRRRWLALYMLCMGELMIVLDTTIVNVALPSIRQDLAFSVASGEGGPELRWDPARASRWPAARIAESRAALPDRELGRIAGEARFPRRNLSTGVHRRKGTLTATDPETGAAQIADAPPCSVDLEVRSDGSAVALTPPPRPEPTPTANAAPPAP